MEVSKERVERGTKEMNKRQRKKRATKAIIRACARANDKTTYPLWLSSGDPRTEPLTMVEIFRAAEKIKLRAIEAIISQC